VTRKTYTCPLCGGALEQLQNDPWNRWLCNRGSCYFRANPMPADVAECLGNIGAGMDWAFDNAFWFGFLSCAGLAGAIAMIVWFLS
jgi:hypothetical protein